MLYQLPPRWGLDLDRLAGFLEALPPRRPQAIEFRDRSWYAAQSVELLEGAGVALCLHDMAGSQSPRQPIGPFVYVRLHGAGAKYGGRYTSQALSAWAGRLAEWSASGRLCYVYFNNDVGGHAPRDAARLREMVDRRRG
jgi:uncharacterized protein YecE (DUF72 family)